MMRRRVKNQNASERSIFPSLLAFLVPAPVKNAVFFPAANVSPTTVKTPNNSRKISRFFLENRSQKRYTGNVEAARSIFLPRFPRPTPRNFTGKLSVVATYD